VDVAEEVWLTVALSLPVELTVLVPVDDSDSETDVDALDVSVEETDWLAEDDPVLVSEEVADDVCVVEGEVISQFKKVPARYESRKSFISSTAALHPVVDDKVR
jgi:hypothetical protein